MKPIKYWIGNSRLKSITEVEQKVPDFLESRFKMVKKKKKSWGEVSQLKADPYNYVILIRGFYSIF